LAQGPNWGLATEGLGEHYNITRVTQKNHGCCGHSFSSIDAALVLRQQHKIDPAQIKSIVVQLAGTPITLTGRFAPTTAYECKFSLPYVVAHALLYGSVRLNAFSPERITDPAIRDLMKKVTLSEDPAMTATFPKMRSARVLITLQDGRQVEQFQPHRKGDPELPLSDAELNDKFYELVSPVIGEPGAHSLLEQLWKIEASQVADLKLAALRCVSAKAKTAAGNG
jgi:2-methylcitrate dehydratase PrpD